MSFLGRVDAFNLDLMWSTRLRCRALVKTRGELRTMSASTQPRSTTREKDVAAACSGRASRGRACRIKPKMRRPCAGRRLALSSSPASRRRRRRDVQVAPSPFVVDRADVASVAGPRTRQSRSEPCHKKTRTWTLGEKDLTAARVGRAPREHARAHRRNAHEMRPPRAGRRLLTYTYSASRRARLPRAHDEK